MNKSLAHLFQIKYLIFFLIIIAAFLRLYNFPNTLMFQGDQGRDAILVARIWREHDPVFIGPVMSVGNLYLGPLYYYFMLPFLFVTYPSPLGPAVAVAILGTMSVGLIYYLGKKLVGETAAFFASFFLTFSYVAVEYSRFSWNPNPAPFVSILLIYFTYKAWTKNVWYWLLVSVCVSVLIQLHYVTLLSAVGAGLIWLIQLATFVKNKEQRTKNKNFNKFVICTFLSLIIFLLSLTPLVLFDFKHNYVNAYALQSMFTKEDALEQKGGLLATLKETHGRGMHILYEATIGQVRQLNSSLYWLSLISLAILLAKAKGGQDEREFQALVVIVSFLLTGILGTAIYQHTVFNHYILYLLPITFLIYGIFAARLWRSSLGKLLVIIFIIVFLQFNLVRLPLKSLGWTIKNVSEVAQEILTHVDENEQYNVILLSESKDLYAQNYRYYLEASQHQPLGLDEYALADKLIVINESQPGVDVAALPIYEIVTFPRDQVETFPQENGPDLVIFSR